MYNKAYYSDHGGVCKNVLITDNYYFTVPVARDEMILMQENLLQGPLDWVGPLLPMAPAVDSAIQGPKKS